MKLVETNLLEVLSQFPEINKLEITKIEKSNYDFFFSALGFEERTLGIPKELAISKKIKFDETIYFQYETSTTENAYNEPKLLEYFKVISKKRSKLFCDEPNFITLLKDIIFKKTSEKISPDCVKIIFDISVCSSKLILSVIKTLLELDVQLTVVYTEAKKYFPEYSEYIADPIGFKEKVIALDDTVVLNSDFPGGYKQNPDLIISFPNFKAQRAKNIISEIDETILLKPDDRLIWIVGTPNMDSVDADNRKKMMLDVNDIPENAKIYEVSTLDYKKTIEKLEHIYTIHNFNHHINIADLGSKMQTLAIAIYCLLRPDISIYNTNPKVYSPSKYSQGIRQYWFIEFGNTSELVDKLNTIDTIILE